MEQWFIFLHPFPALQDKIFKRDNQKDKTGVVIAVGQKIKPQSSEREQG